jgi:hypothetical protein
MALTKKKERHIPGAGYLDIYLTPFESSSPWVLSKFAFTTVYYFYSTRTGCSHGDLSVLWLLFLEQWLGPLYWITGYFPCLFCEPTFVHVDS